MFPQFNAFAMDLGVKWSRVEPRPSHPSTCSGASHGLSCRAILKIYTYIFYKIKTHLCVFLLFYVKSVYYLDMANPVQDILARLRQILGGQQQQELLNPLVTPEDEYVSRLKTTMEKSGTKFGQNEEIKARQIYRTEMARKQQATPRPIATPVPVASAAPAVLGAAATAFSIDPKTLPTYNNPKMLERVNPYVEYIKKSAQSYGMPPELLAAALWRESAGFNPKYISGRHMDSTGRGIAGIDAVQRRDVPDTVAYDPPQAIDWMAKTLKGYADQESGNYYNALRRYNGGPKYDEPRPGYQGVPVNQLTKKHADYITSNAENLKSLFSQPTASPTPFK